MNGYVMGLLSGDVFQTILNRMSLKEQNNISNWDIKLRLVKGYSIEKTASIIDRAYKIYFMRRDDAQR